MAFTPRSHPARRRKHACTFTGFLPVHAVVANGHKSMFDFLLALPQLPTLYDMRGDENALSQSGTLSHLTPLQLACFLGDHDMCERTRTGPPPPRTVPASAD